MRDYLPYIVFGLTTGSVYGLAAMGLVLTYKTSGLFNFAHGAVGAAAAFTFYELRQVQGLPWPIAAVVSVLALGATIGVLLERLADRLSQVTTTNKIVGTIGLLLTVRALAIVLFGPEFLPFRPFLPQTPVVTVAGVAVTADNVVTLGVGVVVALGLHQLFRRTRLGTTMRAVVDDPPLLDLTGQSPTAVRRQAWVIGSVLASASGVLFAAQQQQLDATLLSLLVVQAFGAAALGAFTSLPLAFAGGIAVGVLQKLVSKEVSSVHALQGLDLNIPFLALFVVLLLLPKHRLVEIGQQVRGGGGYQRAVGDGVRRTGTGAALAGALVLPFLVGSRLPLWTNGLSQVVLFLSLALLVRTSGQISLCQIGFAAVGAAAFGHFLAAGIPWGFAVLLAGLVSVPVGAIVAIPAIRLSGLFLALATLGFGILLAQFFYLKDYLFGVSDLRTSRPHAFGLDSDRGYYYLLLGVALLAASVVVRIERSRLGRLLRALADSPVALTTIGTSVNVSRVLVFCISAFLAGTSGAVYSAQFGSINSNSFGYVQSLVVLAVLAVSGRSTVGAAFLAPVLLFVVPGYVDSPTLNDLLQLGFGLGAVGSALTSRRSGGRWFGRAAGRDWTRSLTTTQARQLDGTTAVPARHVAMTT